MKNRFNINKIYICLLLAMVLGGTACKKLAEVSAPPTGISEDNVYRSDATAASVMTGVYASMSKSSLGGGDHLNSFMNLYPGLSGDDFTLLSGTSETKYLQYYGNKLTNITTPNIWRQVYPTIYICNSVLTGVAKYEDRLSTMVTRQLKGEARFMRALNYFYLINLYGDVPLVLTTDYQQSKLMSRTPKAEVYKQVVADLLEAQNLLSQDFLDATLTKSAVERVRPSYWSATSLLARVYLYLGDYTNADIQATKVIEKTTLFGLSTLSSAFLKASMGNNEAIWQLQPVNTGQNTLDALFFILPASGPSAFFPVYLSDGLMSSFEGGDQRRTNWTGSITVASTSYSYPAKYKVNTQNAPVTEFHTVLRLAEQFLIRAEARANGAGLGLDGAKADLNMVRNRAGLSGTPAVTKDEVLAAIQKERRVELFAEWGHRWLDIKRWGNVNTVMTAAAVAKGTSWSADAQLYPIHVDDLRFNPNLVPNNGY